MMTGGNTRMNRIQVPARLVALCVSVLVLQGCTAAAMVRDRPDFEDERQRYAPLSFDFRPAVTDLPDGTSG